MNKKITKILLMGVVLIMMFTLTACVDYEYEYHFSVVNGNGSVSTKWGNESPQYYLGGKNGHSVEFTAIPNEGYKVKEWTLNGEVVKNNQTNNLKVYVVELVNYVTVEFEPI